MNTLERAAREAYAAHCGMDPLDGQRQPDWGRTGFKIERMVWNAVVLAVLKAIREPLKQWASEWPESGSAEFDAGFAQGISSACDFLDIITEREGKTGA